MIRVVILSKFALRLCVIEGENMQMNDVEKFRQEILERIVMMRKFSGQDK